MKSVSETQFKKMKEELQMGHGALSESMHANLGKSFSNATSSFSDFTVPLGETPAMDLLGGLEMAQASSLRLCLRSPRLIS